MGSGWEVGQSSLREGRGGAVRGIVQYALVSGDNEDVSDVHDFVSGENERVSGDDDRVLAVDAVVSGDYERVSVVDGT